MLLIPDIFGVNGPGFGNILGPSDDGPAIGEQRDFVSFDLNSHHVLIEIDLPALIQASREVVEIGMGFLLGRYLHCIPSAQASHLSILFSL